jgi:hypothetical protein
LPDEIHSKPHFFLFLVGDRINSDWPNLSMPKFLIASWVAGATIKSAKAFPPAALIRGPLAGFTSITE